MKFLHTSDIHYGATPDADKPWGKERAAVLKDAFDRIIRACRRERIDLLLIAGDLFDSLPTEQQINAVNEAFKEIPETRVVIAPGNNDKIFASSPVLTFSWSENVTYIAGTASAPAFYDAESGICMHVGNPEDIPNQNQYEYIALGGKHKSEILNNGQAVYSGSPEPIVPSDTGKHGYYIGEIGEDRKLVSLKFISLPTTRYISLSANITPASKNAEVVKVLKKEIERRGAKNIYRIKLKGLADPSVTFDLSSLMNTYRIDEIIDCTEPKYDLAQLFKDHPSDMIGFFVREMNRDDISDLDKKALYYGVNALLKTADERS